MFLQQNQNKYFIRFAIMIFAACYFSFVNGQNGVAINTTGASANNSAILDLSNSVNKGLLLPQVSSTSLIASPATGLVVYQTGAPAGFYYYNGTTWVLLGSSSGNANYIFNQTSVQSGANFNIGGAGVVGTTFNAGGISTLNGITNTGVLNSLGGAVNLNSPTAGGNVFATNINVGTGTSNNTGSVSIGGGGAGPQTLNIGTGFTGSNANTIAIGSGSAGSAANTISIGSNTTGNAATTISIGTNAGGSSTNNITIGPGTGNNNTTILSGTNGANINTTNANPVTIGGGGTGQTVTVGGGINNQTINLGSTISAGTSTIGLGNNVENLTTNILGGAVNINTGASLNKPTNINANGATGTLNIGGATSSVPLGAVNINYGNSLTKSTNINTGTNNSGIVSIGGTANTTNQTINIGGTGLQTINVGTGLGNNSVINVGSVAGDAGNSKTTITSGTSGVNINAGISQPTNINTDASTAAINIGGSTTTPPAGAVNINYNVNKPTNISTGTNTNTVTIGNANNNVNLPKLSASSVVITDASKNLASAPAAPSGINYLNYNSTTSTFGWASSPSAPSKSKIEIAANDVITSDNTNNNAVGSTTSWEIQNGGNFQVNNSFSINQSTASQLANYTVTTTGQTFNGLFGWLSTTSNSSRTATISVYRFTPVSGGSGNITGSLLSTSGTITIGTGTQTYLSLPTSATSLTAGDVLIAFITPTSNAGFNFLFNSQIEILSATQ